MTHGINPTKLKYLVFAGNFKEYRQWALTSGALNGESLYVAHPTNLMGLKGDHLKLVRVGTFHLRKDSQEILEKVRTRFTADQWTEYNESDPTS